MDWTEETISRLRSLWQEGLSTAEIGRRMSITKNAVVGKAHRLTLPPRPSPIRKGPAREGMSTGSTVQQASRLAEVAQLVPRPANPAGANEGVTGAHKGNSGATVTPLRSPPPAAAPVRTQVPVAAVMPVQATPELTATSELPAVSLRSSARPGSTQSSGRRYGQSCCWPLGEPGTKQFHFCGGEPIPGKPYCGEHAQLAYVKLRDRRDTVA